MLLAAGQLWYLVLCRFFQASPRLPHPPHYPLVAVFLSQSFLQVANSLDVLMYLTPQAVFWKLRHILPSYLLLMVVVILSESV